MLSQLLKEMDEYLANKPFKRRWWSRPWVAHMAIFPPLSKDFPLWKRNPEELLSFRLFDLRPEELRQKIDRYWQKPRWRRWFSAWGMKKKIDVWNYYQRCLAYQAVRPDVLESVTYSSKHLALFNELGLCFYKFTKKFETQVEKRCRNPQWMKKHFAKEIKTYQQQLKKTFLIQLNKSLKKIPRNEPKHRLKQQAQQEYQQLEGFMLRYYHQWLSDFFSRLPQPLVPEVNHDRTQPQNRPNSENHLAVYHEPAGSSAQQTFLSSDHETQIHSLHNIQEWINQQRQRLTLFVEKDSLQKVEALLQSSLNEIKNITELHLGYCEMMLSNIQDQPQTYDAFLQYLDNLQRRLKPLLQSGILLFHPDHIQHLGPSPAMWNLIGRFSQFYLEQNRYYLDKFKNYHQRIEAFCQQPHLQQTYSNLIGQLRELEEKLKQLQQFFKEFNNELNKFNERWTKDKAELEAQRERDKTELEAQRERDKTELEAQRERDKAEMEAQRERDKVELEDKMNKLFERFTAQSSLATASAVDTEQSSKLHFNP